MRMSRLAEWVAGGVAGFPGTVDTTAPDDPPTPTPAPRGRTASEADASRKQHRHRRRWVTVAAVILVVYGGLGIVYAPFLVGGAVWTFLGVGISSLTIHAPTLVAAVASAAWGGIDWLGIAGSLVVLFAVLRRWPAEPVGAD